MLSSLGTFMNQMIKLLNEAEVKFFEAAKNGDVATINDFFDDKIPSVESPKYKTANEKVARNIEALKLAIKNKHQHAIIAIIEKARNSTSKIPVHRLSQIFMESVYSDLDEVVDYLFNKKLIDPKKRLPICSSLYNYVERSQYFSTFYPYELEYKDGATFKIHDEIYTGYQNPLYLACVNGSEKVVQLLLNLNPSVVDIDDGKYGLIENDGSEGEGGGYIVERFDEQAVVVAQNYPRIAHLLTQHFGATAVENVINPIKHNTKSVGCVIC